MSWKESLLVTWEMLRMFVNTLTADDKYPLLNRGNLTQHIQMHLSQTESDFSQFFYGFSKSTLNFEYFRKKITLVIYVFLKIRAPKYVVR